MARTQYLWPSFGLALLFTGLALSAVSLGFAQVRTSTNYQLQSDSVNFAGGLSSSTSYVQESTLGEVGTGRLASTNYQLRAGYQQMQEIYLAMSNPSDVTLSPALSGLTGGTSNGSTTVTVTTDNPAGYRLTLEAENDPAMQSITDVIANYNQGGVADFNFTTSAGASHFGFSPSSIDVATQFRDNGSTCGVGLLDTAGACWSGASTTPVVVTEGTSANHPAGATTTLYFRVGIGSGAGVVSGVYTATTTLTALPL
jgi:hypothetical protein